MRELEPVEFDKIAGGFLLLTGYAPPPKLQVQAESWRPQVAPSPFVGSTMFGAFVSRYTTTPVNPWII